MLDIKINLDTRKFVRYDESLFDVYVLDYGDNYHRSENEPTSEFEREVRKIKARYKDILKYNAACALYSEYMEYLYEKHGGRDLFKLKNRAGLINDYIPPKPRIKNTKELKFLKKNRIIIGSVGRFFIDYDKLDDIADRYSEGMNTDDIVVDKIKDKDIDKILDQGSAQSKKYRHLKSQSFKDDVDYLESYFRNKNYYSSLDKKKSKKKKKGKKNDEYRIKISDLMRSDYEAYVHDDTSMEDSDSGSLMLYNGMILSSGTSKELDIYHKLNEIGWNSYKLMKKGDYSSRVTSMFKPPKKKKKGKKGKKKVNNMYDGLIIDILNDNGFDVDDMDSFEEFQKEMLNMTSDSVFR